MGSIMDKKTQFECGVVIALDYIADVGEGTYFKEIVLSAGKNSILNEITKNGLKETKEMAKVEFPEYFKKQKMI